MSADKVGYSPPHHSTHRKIPTAHPIRTFTVKATARNLKILLRLDISLIGRATGITRARYMNTILRSPG